MSADLSFSHHSSGLGAPGFRDQLRRLESLQTLMIQGGQVVAEVADFMVRARAELAAFQEEQRAFSEAQRQLDQEKAELAARVASLEEALASAEDRLAQRELLVGSLRQQQEQQDVEEGAEREELEQRVNNSEKCLGEAQARIAALERALTAERKARELGLSQAREAAAAAHPAEMDAVKNRLAALEQQLASERERRSRLMEVVKTAELRVAERASLSS
jgi:chromosome segregation ATPase